ncbi:MAG: peptidylprolyl isomerase [Rhodospirillales bacterium]|nr:peptidylprolyl isomerase [Rhodospirillales bacterium]
MPDCQFASPFRRAPRRGSAAPARVAEKHRFLAFPPLVVALLMCNMGAIVAGADPWPSVATFPARISLMSFRFLSLAAATVLLSASLAAAQPKPAGPAAPAAPAAAPGDPAAAPGDPVVARINGTELHRSDVVSAQESLPPQVQQMPLEQIYPQLLDQMITQELIIQNARKQKLQDDPEVKKRMAQIEDRVVGDVWLKHEVDKVATDQRLHADYDKFAKEHSTEQVKASHILVGTEAEAKSVIADLNKGGDFAAIAKKRSTDPGKDNGGDLGWFSREDMVPAFANAAFALTKGQYTKTPVQTQFGWHVIKLEDRRTQAPPSFEQAEPELKNAIAHDVVAAKVKEMKAAANVQTFGLDGTPTPALSLAPADK